MHPQHCSQLHTDCLSHAKVFATVTRVLHPAAQVLTAPRIAIQPAATPATAHVVGNKPKQTARTACPLLPAHHLPHLQHPEPDLTRQLLAFTPPMQPRQPGNVMTFQPPHIASRRLLSIWTQLCRTTGATVAACAMPDCAGVQLRSTVSEGDAYACTRRGGHRGSDAWPAPFQLQRAHAPLTHRCCAERSSMMLPWSGKVRGWLKPVSCVIR